MHPSAPRKAVLDTSSGEHKFSVRTETDSTVMVSPSSTGGLATPPIYHKKSFIKRRTTGQNDSGGTIGPEAFFSRHNTRYSLFIS
jgi:hypothetical protein